MRSTDNKKPATASQAVSLETRQRRERGRAAQAAFRKRQIDTIQSQQEQLSSFGDAFKVVSHACSKLKLAVKMSEALGNGDVPAYIAKDILDQIEQALTQVPGAGSTESKCTARTLDGPLPSATSESLEASTALTGSSRVPAALSESQDPRLPTKRQSSARRRGGQTPNTNADEAPNMSLMPIGSDIASQSIVVHMTPIDLVPYLAHAQHAQHTFAGRLFWSTLTFAFQMVNRFKQKDLTAKGKMFRYFDQDFVKDHIRKRIAIKLITNSTGVVEADTTPEMSSYMTELVTKGMAAEGEQMHDYLDPREVELYLRRRYIDPNHLDLVAMTGDLSDQSLADQLATSLVQQISSHGVCFGDAPRYHVRDIENACETVISISKSFPPSMQLPLGSRRSCADAG